MTGEREAVRGLYGVETLDDLTIEGIVFDAKDGSVAIVNGEIVRKGDTWDNLKIMDIQPNGVLFEISEIEQFKSFGQDE